MQIVGDGGANEIPEGGFVEGITFVEIDRAANVAIEACVEEMGGVRESGTFGEGKFDGLLVGFTRTDDATMRPDGNPSPFALFQDARVGLMDELTNPGEGFSTPVCELADLRVDKRGSSLVRHGSHCGWRLPGGQPQRWWALAVPSKVLMCSAW